jgi:hypothetical protein
MTMLTANDIEEYYPDVFDNGIQEFDQFFTKTQNDIYRRLRIDWFPKRQYDRLIDIDFGIRQVEEMNESLLVDSQFTRAAVFHCLAYYILPQLTKFSPEGDQFVEMMKYYKERYEEEWQLILRDGVKYDFNEDGVIDPRERRQVNTIRLVR